MQEPLSNLFTFPVVLIDGMVEQRKMVLDLPNANGDLDIVYGEAECPYQDFVSVVDKWLPTEESFDKAKDGVFEACYVIFTYSGSFLVPWSKEEFKKRYTDFVKKQVPDRPVIMVNESQLKKLLNPTTKKKKEDEPGDTGE